MDAFTAFRKFYGRRGLFFLDSSQAGPEARYSYLGFEPFKTVSGRDLRVLKKEFDQYRRPSGKTFSGGAVGYWGYDGRFYFGLYDQVLAFDHARCRLTVHASTRRQANDILDALAHAPAHVSVIAPLKKKIVFKSNFSRAQYIAAVKKALTHIRRGDIYQINLSRKVEALIKGWQGHADPMAVYAALRARSPSPFAAYFDDGQQVILSSSPERFLRLNGRIAQVKPMKGTRPRGKTQAEDARLKKDLLQSPKEIAELLMVTDLERNDLGRVCDYGSVTVKARRAVEEYRTVFQATATVEGHLHKDKDLFDLLKATFPSGSVTGCPKIEAMKIIRQMEGDSRELYTGALGYIGFNGNMDFSVLIRALFLRRDRISFHVGGGIVADSDPAAEYEETCVKAVAMQAALAEVFYA